ncbi:hypothetical protein SpCBS45565_g00422 [Spizellomyces sp. 'palustris']|nr:hypothetical protein SpCBS45565_g00422 [Spizellomyces sp. 'palustris']
MASRPKDVTTLSVGGLPLHILGLSTIPPSPKPIQVVFFAHGRLNTAEASRPICQDIYSHLPPSTLMVTFDQRNHGHRIIHPLANESWKKGNDNHAIDMWAIQYGTARDVSYLMDILPAFLGRDVEAWGMCGVSLGGHATLLALANDPRLQTGVSIIGCGDYLTLMTHRSQKSTPQIPLPPASERYINSQLVSVLQAHDPIHRAHAFRDKALLLLNGGSDKLVPASCNEAFISQLGAVMDPERFDVVVEDGVKHAVTETMKERCGQWLARWITTGDKESGTKSRI